MHTKYVIVEKGGLTYPMVFSNLMSHREVANAIGGTVIGAGFCHITHDSWRCYGESVILRVSSRGADDSNILDAELRG